MWDITLWNSDAGRWDSDWRDDRLWLGAAPEHPDADTRAEEEREDVGDDDRVEELGFPLGAAEHAAVLGRGLGGRAAAAAGAPPRLGRRDVGARAPVPDEVGDGDLGLGVEVHVAQAEVRLRLLAVHPLVVGAVGRRLGRLGGGDVGAGSAGAGGLGLAQQPHAVAELAQHHGRHRARAEVRREVHPGASPGDRRVRHGGTSTT